MKISILPIFGTILLLVLIFILNCHAHEYEHDHEHSHSHDDYDLNFVTCGSVIKLRHVSSGTRLHSHEVKYGSGSGQQSVTSFPNVNDPNSLWVIKSGHGEPHCARGTLLKNGDVIRLQHLSTGRNLHSHLHQSPLSGQQEVSAYGEGGNGDTGDNWKLVISSNKGWKRGDSVYFQHVDTGKWLSSNNNKYGNPIPGQQEVCCISSKRAETEWVAEEGFYFPVESN